MLVVPVRCTNTCEVLVPMVNPPLLPSVTRLAPIVMSSSGTAPVLPVPFNSPPLLVAVFDENVEVLISTLTLLLMSALPKI